MDPETGALGMPTPEQLAQLQKLRTSLSHSDEGLVQITHPGGYVTMDLQGRFQECVVARIGPDGKPVIGCVDNVDDLLRALRPSPARTEPEDR